MQIMVRATRGKIASLLCCVSTRGGATRHDGVSRNGDPSPHLQRELPLPARVVTRTGRASLNVR
jgi:hypothetical protein